VVWPRRRVEATGDLKRGLTPTAFSSTYAIEAAFPEERWRQRLANPLAKVFVAVTSDTRQILSTLVLVGPQPRREGDSEPGAADSPPPLHWVVNAVYTAVEARRRGIGRALLAAARGWASREAASQRRDGLLTAQAYEANAGAVAFYREAGFVESDATAAGAVGLELRLHLSNEGLPPVS